MQQDKKILIIGATSEIAYQAAKYFAAEGTLFYLIGRNEERLASIANDLTVRGAKKVIFETKDAYALKEYQNLAQIVCDKIGGIDIVLIAHGVLANQEEAEKNPKLIEDVFQVNFISYAYVISYLMPYFIKQKNGIIAVISSVAGDKGRQSNYIYGASKAALTRYAEGLRGRLFRYGVHVLTIKPGFVSTPMTQHLRQGFLFADPQKVGYQIYKAILKRKDELYTPCFWKLIMFVIRHLPSWVLKRMSF